MASHTPDARAQPAEWSKGPDGEDRWSGEVTGAWEVICVDCGDDRGPYERQSAAIRNLRGPYPNAASAVQAASQHSQDTS